MSEWLTVIGGAALSVGVLAAGTRFIVTSKHPESRRNARRPAYLAGLLRALLPLPATAARRFNVVVLVLPTGSVASG